MVHDVSFSVKILDNTWSCDCLTIDISLPEADGLDPYPPNSTLPLQPARPDRGDGC